jgi:hypothetical protein
MSMHEILDVEFPYLGCIVNPLIPPETVMVVPLQEELAPVVEAVELGVPAPTIEIPMLLGTVIPVVQLHDPEGILIVSPSTAVCVGPLMTAFTSLWLQEAAV